MLNNLERRIFVAGHQGLVGSAIVRALKRRGYRNILTRTRAQLDLTSQVELAAFDDPDFHDRMQRARDRGVFSAAQLVNDVINFVTAFAGLASAAVVVGVLQPILLAVLLIAQLPGAWSAVRSARIRYLTRFALSDSYRRKWILADLIAERRTAAEIRSFTLRTYLLSRVSLLTAYARSAVTPAGPRARRPVAAWAATIQSSFRCLAR